MQNWMKIFPLAIAVAYFEACPCFAQSFFNFGSQNTTQPPAPSTPLTTKKIMSPDEFKNAVNVLNQQTVTAISQQIKPTLAPIPVVAPNPTPNIPTPHPTATTTTSVQPNIIPKPPAPKTPAPPPIQAPITQAPPAPTTIVPNMPPPATTQPSIYTGFGTQNPNNTNNQPGTTSTNSFTIKY